MTAPPGAINTSPVVVSGALPFWGGPQASQVLARGGTVTLNSGTPVAVSDTSVTANSIILLTLKTVGGTVAAPFVATITPGTGFTVNGGGSDTSVYNYLILG